MLMMKFMKDNLLITKLMDLEHIFIKTKINMLVTGKMIKLMELVLIMAKMVLYIREIEKKINKKKKEKNDGLMGQYMLVVLKMECEILMEN